MSEEMTLAAVIRRLGLKIGGGTYRNLQFHIRRLGIDTSHFLGKGWARGQNGVTFAAPRPLDEILVKDSPHQNVAHLRERLFKEGVKERRCEACGLTRWRRNAVPLMLDHINGVSTDHRLENLRILCPNCHSQTDTWCGRNKGRASDIEEPEPT